METATVCSQEYKLSFLLIIQPDQLNRPFWLFYTHPQHKTEYLQRRKLLNLSYTRTSFLN